RIVYGASTDPNSVTPAVALSLGSASGSRIGGSLPPSGVNDPRKTASGTENGTGDAKRARSRRGTGTPASRTSTLCHTNGASKLPCASTAMRTESLVAVHGGDSLKQSAP